MSRADLYDGEHQAVRRALLAVCSPADPCWRCNQPLGPDPSLLDLGHRDDGAGWSGLEHARCNRAAGAAKGNRQRRQQRRWRMDRIGTGTLGVEVAADRGHTSVCSAGRLDDGRVQVELVAYFAGTPPPRSSASWSCAAAGRCWGSPSTRWVGRPTCGSRWRRPG